MNQSNPIHCIKLREIARLKSRFCGIAQEFNVTYKLWPNLPNNDENESHTHACKFGLAHLLAAHTF
jgi:hypothetical protein